MSIQPRTATVTIYGGDYIDRIRLLERKAEAAQDAEATAPRRMSTVPEYVKLAEEHDALVAEAEAQALHVTLRALKRSAWKALIAEHPPREGNKEDAALGANEDTLKDALVAASIVSPDLSADDLDDLSDADFDRLYITAFALNRGTVAAPKANLASRMRQESSETSD